MSGVVRGILEAWQKHGFSSPWELIAAIAVGIFLITSIYYAVGMFGRERGDLAAAIFTAVVLSTIAAAVVLFVWYS